MKGLLKFLFLLTVLLFSVNISYAQPELPPRSVTIAATQAIDFGRFCVTGSGGTITLGWDGSRISTGGIALISSPTAQPAIFEIKLCQGRNVTITYASTATLTGSNGGTLTLDIGPTEKGVSGSSFPTNGDCNFITPLRVGGTLHIPGTTVPGIYTGSFDITFTQH
ncbi:MAG: DUF4402 domain-containing protein [Bacteroidales bacterium]|nr:DUF4402 domain-containing protein [Bacteroidales bacterium]